MKIILLKDVKNVGKKDQVKEVSDGYAANFLIPKGLAMACNKANTAKLQKEKEEQAYQDSLQKLEAQSLAEKLARTTLEFALKTGKEGNTFGQISTKQIAAALEKEGIHVDKRKIMMDVPVDSLGTTMVKVDLYKGQVIGEIKVHVSEK